MHFASSRFKIFLEDKMKTAVTGAFSYSGKYIAKRLLAQGAKVITLTDHPNRTDPFNGKVKAHPFNFDRPEALIESLRGIDVLYNTYWVRFDKGNTTQPGAVEKVKTLIKAADAAGVKRIVHISITKPSHDSPLPYFHGKAEMEKAVRESSMSYAILRPTVLFGKEDVLINNIAWLLRHFPFMPIMGDGSYTLQPVYVDDLAALAVSMGSRSDNVIMDAVGPEVFTFIDMVKTIGNAINHPVRVIPMNPALALFLSQIVSVFVNDVVLTKHEVDGLMANLLISDQPAACPTKLSDWLIENKNTVGTVYASEIKKHYK
jgi:NADH dehydrogenase